MSIATQPRASPSATDPIQAAQPTFVLTFDLEDWHQLVHRRLRRPDWRAGSEEFVEHVSATLDLLDKLDVTATFFVAGMTAERHPAALRAVVAAGHEVACHGYIHRRVYQQTPEEFRADVSLCKEVLADVCGGTPTGYRAPWFSINRDSRWAHGILRELGFRYDSSLYDSPRLPRRLHPIPAHPFRVAEGLWEFPIAVARWRSTVLPLGGGAYWRAMPGIVIRHGLERVARSSTFPVLYFHPYEFANEPLRVALPAGATGRQRLRETARRVSKNARRELIATRIREAASRFRFVPFRDILGDDFDAKLLREARRRV
jgi:polysaccharide deacetylase family protein (PEP-CTERM system associated)